MYLERVFVFNDTISAEPRFEATLWSKALPEYRGVSATVTIFPPPEASDWEGGQLHANLQLENTEDESVTVPAEVTFLAAGRPLPIETDDGRVNRFSTVIPSGTLTKEVVIDVSDLGSGEVILVHSVAYPGMPRVGTTPDGETCASASAGILGGLTPIQYQSLVVP